MTFLFSLPVVLTLAVFALVSALLSLSETSIIGLSKLRLRHMVAKGVRHAKTIQNLITHSDRLIVGILVGNNIANIAFSSVLTAVFINLLGERMGTFLATAFLSFFILIFLEIMPKTLAVKNPEKMALFTAPGLAVFLKLINPLSRVFMSLSDLVLRMLGLTPPKREPLITEEELRLMIEVGKEEGVLTDEERRLLHRIFEFGSIRVADAMIPKEKMVAVASSSSADQVLDVLAEEGHSRIPVYRGSIDRVIGVIYARDLLYILRDRQLFALEDLIRPVPCVPAAMKVNELLRKFQTEKIQIAVVVDKENKTLGLVTLEDLLEEIVGEIEESHSVPE